MIDAVFCSAVLFRYGCAEQGTGYMIPCCAVLAVGLPGDVDNRFLVEVIVFNQGLDEAVSPGTRHSDVGVETVVVKIGSHKELLG